MQMCSMSNTGNTPRPPKKNKKHVNGYWKKKKWQQSEQLEVFFLDFELQLLPKASQKDKTVSESWETLSRWSISWSTRPATLAGNATNPLFMFKSPPFMESSFPNINKREKNADSHLMRLVFKKSAKASSPKLTSETHRWLKTTLYYFLHLIIKVGQKASFHPRCRAPSCASTFCSHPLGFI